MRFENKVVAITGAARGIGFAAASLFASEGARVAIVDLDPEHVAQAAERIGTSAGRVIGVPGDVSDDRQVQRNVETILSEWGMIDILVNNAAIHNMRPSHEVEPEDWRRTIDVNLSGMFYWSRAVARQSMIPRRSGTIVNVASGAGVLAMPHSPDYVASKHGVVGLTRALAVDWGQFGIRVNALAPGLTWTELALQGKSTHPEVFEEREKRIPLGRAATMEEQAKALLFLASSDSGSMHGQVLTIDGGTMALSSGYSAPRGDT